MQLNTCFTFGERVRVDGSDIVGVITAFEARPGVCPVHRYELSWFNNGDVKFCTFDEFRLTKTATESG